MALKYNVIGLMSGTSMDGLDVVYCELFQDLKGWGFCIKNATTISYSKGWLEKLNGARKLNDKNLEVLHNEYGEYLAYSVQDCLSNWKISEVDFVASHGHTIHHQPDKGYTVQIGSGELMVKILNIPVVNDFRSADVRLGGQGAPLVPIGDSLLFNQYGACLNLGGFANISFSKNGKREAFDIGPANIILNYISKRMGFDYDEYGVLAKSGVVLQELLQKLNVLPYYSKSLPKSLGVEWVEQFIYPEMSLKFSNIDLLRTLVEHITDQIALVIDKEEINSILITGGGAFNTFLIENLKVKVKSQIIVPINELVNYKEALIFAFLGVLRWENRINVLSTVTGAKHDHCSGQIHMT
ncbi:MAG: anhydro-N-acetylmuramic acid kinase [Salibacteraceae bacterium]